jgi:hypothetical protein
MTVRMHPNPAAIPSLHSRIVSILWGARRMHPSPFITHGFIPGRERSCGALPRSCPGVNPVSKIVWFLHCLSSAPLCRHSRSF